MAEEEDISGGSSSFQNRKFPLNASKELKNYENGQLKYQKASKQNSLGNESAYLGKSKMESSNENDISQQGKQMINKQGVKKKRSISEANRGRKLVYQEGHIYSQEKKKNDQICNEVIQSLENNLKILEDSEEEKYEEDKSMSQLQKRIQKVEQIKKDLLQLTESDQLGQYYDNYQVQAKEVLQKDKLSESPNFKIKKYKQSVYFGELQNSSKTGMGIMLYHSGKVYEGEWQNDLKFGQGYELYPNGNVYLGFFVNGKPEGSGIYIWSNGEIYDGQWVNGMKHGEGQWMGIKRDNFIGEWKFGKPDGKGIHRWVNGDVYEGEFKSCLKHGEGKEFFQNGDVYIGSYSNGRPEGQGKYLWNDGAVYEGFFKNGLRHGQGKWQKNKGGDISDTYEGEYFNDKRCGYGVFTWASGNKYKGQYFDDLRHGYGEMYWNDSSYYKGLWEKGIQCGGGELFTPSEGLKKGIFQQNTLKLDGQQSQQFTLANNNQNQKLFRTVSEEASTPRGIPNHQSNSKRSFVHQTPDLSDEGSANFQLSSQHLTKLNQKENNKIPPNVTDFQTKLPAIHNKNRDSIRSDSSTNTRRTKGKYNQEIDESQDKNNYDYNVNSGNNNHNNNDNNNHHQENDSESNFHENTYYSYGNYRTEDGGAFEYQNQLNNGNMKNQQGGLRRSQSLQQRESRSTQTQTKLNNSQNRGMSIENERESRNQTGSFLPELGEQIPHKKRRKTSPKRRKKQILLKKDEIILWNIKRPKLCLKPKELKDLTDSKTVEIIRNHLHPPVWKPSGVQHSLEESQSRERFSLSPSTQSKYNGRSPRQK